MHIMEGIECTEIVGNLETRRLATSSGSQGIREHASPCNGNPERVNAHSLIFGNPVFEGKL